MSSKAPSGQGARVSGTFAGMTDLCSVDAAAPSAANASSTTGATAPALTVLFDGACPLCRREVGVYQGLTPLAPLAWTDVSQPQAVLPGSGCGVALPTEADRSKYLARFHVQRADGTVLSGASAFVALWQTLPGWRWLGRLGALPGVTPLLEVTYRAFLHVRPQMQRFARALDTPAIPPALVADLRSDHAGETGAVWIYRGIRAVTRNAALQDFARRHEATEAEHLRRIEAVLPPARRSWLLGPWRVAGWLTGALPALAGPRAVYATIAAVETFVDQHYQHQIDAVDGAAGQPGHPGYPELRELLVHCQAEERHHRDEALGKQTQPPGALLRAWCGVVGTGSAVAVWFARRV